MIYLGDNKGDFVILPTDPRVKSAELLIFLYTANQKEDICEFSFGCSLVLTTNSGIEYSSNISGYIKTDKGSVSHNEGTISAQWRPILPVRSEFVVETISVDEKDDITLYKLFGLNNEGRLHALGIPCMKNKIMRKLQNDILDYTIVIENADLKQLSVKSLDLLNPNQYRGNYCIRLENIEKYLKGGVNNKENTENPK